MKNLGSAFFCITAALVAPSHAATPSEDVQKVVGAFQSAIVAHDGAGLAGMFLPEGGAWLSLMDDSSYRDVKVRRPELPRMQFDHFKTFCDFVGKTDKRIEEKFSNVRINTNGTVAMVYFNYVFLINGIPSNHGDETWQLVRTEAGWKISSMLYSVTLDKQPKS
jgi:hypothetical protein